MSRLRSIELTNFKNVGHGKIEFPSASGAIEGADVVGIYGQNGSGKTAVIEALDVFQKIFKGKSLSSLSPECIRYGCDEAVLNLEIASTDESASCEMPTAILWYCVTIGCEDTPFVKREKLSYTDLRAEKPRKTLLLDHQISNGSSSMEFSSSPKSTWASLLPVSSGFATDYAVAERMAHKEASSFIFSHDFLGILLKISKLFREEGASSAVLSERIERVMMSLLVASNSFREFALGLSVLSTMNNAIVSMNSIALSGCGDPLSSNRAKTVWLDIEQPTVLGKEEFSNADATVNAINAVLNSIIPGLTLDIKRLGDELCDEGDLGTRIEVVSRRGSCVLPFRCESEGVKKIVSILGLLINVYNNENCCVAIDELDSGIFEFLLGEILAVLSEHGKGQLIFTAHNLRPLETLPPRSLVFTTTNPDRRYIEFVGLKKTNNLRDQYLRAVNLGGQSETVYEPTSKYEIDAAFFEAGCLESERCGEEGESHGER